MIANKGLFKGLNPTVTIASKILIIGLVLFCAIFANKAGQYFEIVSEALLYSMKWFYILLLSFVVAFLIYLMISRYGHIRLGKDFEKHEFSYISWLSMLFSGGMGIGLIFWSVAEPITHYASNPFTAGFSNESADMAMRLTFFHWGLHPWAIFIIVALSLSYFAYRKDLPFSLRSILYPLIGNKIYGITGDIIDILSVVVTAWGLSQTLGIAVIQINSGLHEAFGIQISFGIQVMIIIALCTITVASVISGVAKGMRTISLLNMILSLILVLLLLFLGPTRYILNSLIEGSGNYVQNIIGMSLWTDAQQDSGWQNSWTAYYWPWWMIWGSFAGMFIARISRSRTIRELILGSLILPTIITFIWIATFAATAINIEKNAYTEYEQQTSQVITPDTENHHLAQQQTYEADPLSKLLKRIPPMLYSVFLII